MSENAPAVVASVGHLNGAHVHVLRWQSGHIGVSDGAITRAAIVLNSEQAHALGEALLRAADPSTPAVSS
jgi:hypothetical protein